MAANNLWFEYCFPIHRWERVEYKIYIYIYRCIYRYIDDTRNKLWCIVQYSSSDNNTSSSNSSNSTIHNVIVYTIYTIYIHSTATVSELCYTAIHTME